MAKEARLFTPRARLAWPYLFKPRAQTNRDGTPKDGKPKFSLTLIFDAEAQETPEWAALKKAVLDLAAEKFGKLPPALKAKVDLPFRDGADKVDNDGKPYAGYGPGVIYFSASSTIKPGVIGGDMKPLTEEDVYAGCYVRASIVPFDFDNSGNKGISLGLRNVQKMGDGEPFGQGVKAEDEFGAVQGYKAKADEFTQAAKSLAEKMAPDGEVPF